MRLSQFSDYSLRVLMHTALNAPSLSTIDQVASAFQIPRNHLSKIVHTLAKNGFLATRRGVGGGFALGRPASQIRVGHVLRLTEADDVVMDCNNQRNYPCAIFPACTLKNVLYEAATAFFTVLDRYTLEDLLARKKEMRQLTAIKSPRKIPLPPKPR